MQVKIFTLAFNEVLVGFDGTEVRAFLADKRFDRGKEIFDDGEQWGMMNY